MFKGSIVDPEVLRPLVLEPAHASGTSTWQQALRPISETLTNAAPLIFTGLAVAIPFRAGLFNIGGQGQAIMGAIGGGTVGLALSLPGRAAHAAGDPRRSAAWRALGLPGRPAQGEDRRARGDRDDHAQLHRVATSWSGTSGRPAINEPARSDADQQAGQRVRPLLPKIFDRARCGSTSASSWPCSPRPGWPGCSSGARSASSCARSGYNPHAASTAGIKVGTTAGADHGAGRRAGRARRHDHGARHGAER